MFMPLFAIPAGVVVAVIEATRLRFTPQSPNGRIFGDGEGDIWVPVLVEPDVTGPGDVLGVPAVDLCEVLRDVVALVTGAERSDVLAIGGEEVVKFDKSVVNTVVGVSRMPFGGDEVDPVVVVRGVADVGPAGIGEKPPAVAPGLAFILRSEEHTSEIQSRGQPVCRLRRDEKE